jgi:hypothetical protein
METLHNTNQFRNISDRLMLTLAGIVIALICSLVLLHDTHSTAGVSTRLGLGGASKIEPSKLSVDIDEFQVGSAISLFR